MNEDSRKPTPYAGTGAPETGLPAREMVGRTIATKYKIVRPLARGGMGVVYLAEHITLGRQVVFKVLSQHLSHDQKARSRFEREARGLSLLDHPNVVTVHDFGHEDDLTYIVMEYIAGETLTDLVRRRARLCFDELLPIVIQVIDALDAAHSNGIIHRDVKPSNIMVTRRAGRDDFVKVLDFGLAKLASASVDITKGGLVGTVSYLAPEVIRGKASTPASDVYALGVMFYFLCSGVKPFQGVDEMSVLYQHVNEMPEPLHERLPPIDAPREFLDFVHRCMEKNPANRPADAGAMRDLLGELIPLPTLSAFSIDSDAAIPRYEVQDSSAESIPALARDTGPSDLPSGLLEPLVEEAPEAASSASPSMARRRRRLLREIAALAFMCFSVGLAIWAAVNAGAPAGEPIVPVEAAVALPEADEMATPARRSILELRATPGGALAVDGIPRGQTPADLVLKPGHHSLTVSAPGYRKWEQSVEILPGQTRRIDVYLVETGEPVEPASAGLPVSISPPMEPNEPDQETAEPVPVPPPATKSRKSGRHKQLLPTHQSKKELLPVD